MANLGTNYEIPDNDKIGFGCGVWTGDWVPRAGRRGINLKALCHLTSILLAFASWFIAFLVKMNLPSADADITYKYITS